MRIILFKTEKYAPTAQSRTHYFESFRGALGFFDKWCGDEKNEKVALSVLELVNDINYVELAARCLNHGKHVKTEILLVAKDRKRERALGEKEKNDV